MEKPQAVLFDFDGVLGDTMQDNFLAWQKALADFDVKISPEEYFLREGMKLATLAKELCAIGRPGFECVPEEIVTRKELYYKEHHSFSFYPGAEVFVSRLARAGMPIALVTAALWPRLAASVPDPFLKQFQVIISGENGGRGKPFPDPYRNAAMELGVSPGACVVIENAPLGIASAKSAGAYCIAISSTLGKDKLGEADEIVGQIGDIANLDIFNFLS